MSRFWMQGRCYRWLIFFTLMYDLGTGGAVAERLEVAVRLGDRLNGSRIKEGDDVYLECSVSSPSSQFIEVAWHKDGRELAAEARHGVILSSRFLVMQNVKPEQAGLYTCSATRADGAVAESAPFDLHIRHRPNCQATGVQTFEARINETVDVSCDVSADPDDGLRYLWIAADDGGRKRIMRNVAGNETAGGNHVPDVSSRQLEVLVDTFLFNATLSCWAVNDVGMQQQPCQYRFTPRQESMQVSVRLGDRIEGRRIKEGDDVYLECSVSGASTPVTTVTWHQDGRELTTEAAPGFVLSSRFLVIRNVTPGNAGHYTCRATSDGGEVAESAPFDLHIRHSSQA